MRLVVQIIRFALFDRLTKYLTNRLIGDGPIPVSRNRVIGGDCGVGKGGCNSLRGCPTH